MSRRCLEEEEEEKKRTSTTFLYPLTRGMEESGWRNKLPPERRSELAISLFASVFRCCCTTTRNVLVPPLYHSYTSIGRLKEISPVPRRRRRRSTVCTGAKWRCVIPNPPPMTNYCPKGWSPHEIEKKSRARPSIFIRKLSSRSPFSISHIAYGPTPFLQNPARFPPSISLICILPSFSRLSLLFDAVFFFLAKAE